MGSMVRLPSSLVGGTSIGRSPIVRDMPEAGLERKEGRKERTEMSKLPVLSLLSL